jgi:hypothetical protein
VVLCIGAGRRTVAIADDEDTDVVAYEVEAPASRSGPISGERRILSRTPAEASGLATGDPVRRPAHTAIHDYYADRFLPSVRVAGLYFDGGIAGVLEKLNPAFPTVRQAGGVPRLGRYGGRRCVLDGHPLEQIANSPANLLPDSELGENLQGDTGLSRSVAVVFLGAAAHQPVSTPANAHDVPTECPAGLGTVGLSLVDETKEDVLGPDIVVPETARLILCQREHPLRPGGERR